MARQTKNDHMRLSITTATLVVACSIMTVTGAPSPAGAQTRDTERGALERPEPGTPDGQTDARGKPLRMGHPDGPVENQLDKGRPGSNGR